MAAARDKLIASTQVLMLERGYASTGVDDICGRARVSKGAFYHSFSSKEELAVAALETFYEGGLKLLLSIDVSAVAPEQRLLAFLDAVSKQSTLIWERGCLIGGLASEMAAVNPVLRGHVSRMFTQMTKALEPLAEPFVASLAGHEFDATAIVDHFLVVVEGAVVMSRAYGDPQRISLAVSRYAAFLRGLPSKSTAPGKNPQRRRTRKIRR